MGIRRKCIITSFGDRPTCSQLTKYLLDRVYVTEVQRVDENRMELVEVEREHPRWGIRNSNYAKAWAALEEDEVDVLMILDDDMLPVQPPAVIRQGFRMAKRFGICLPMNPRHYAGLNAAVGADMTEEQRREVKRWVPLTQTGVNMGVMFVDRGNPSVRKLLEEYMSILRRSPMRGTTAMDLAIWRTGIYPMLLSPLWCTCVSDIGIRTTTSRNVEISPIMLHMGHEKVRRWFAREPRFKEFRDVWAKCAV